MQRAERTAPRIWLLSVLCTLALTVVPAAGWLIDADLLTTLGADLWPMAPGAVLCFLILTSTVVIRRWAPLDQTSWRRAVLALPAAAGSVSLLALSMAVLRVPIRLESTVVPGTWLMSPITAALLALEALHLILLSARDPQPAAVGILGTGVVLASTGLAIAYIYGAPRLYRAELVPPSVSATLALGGTGLAAALTSSPRSWPVRLFVGSGIRGRLLRRLLPICAVVVLAHAWLGSLPTLESKDRTILSSIVSLAALVTLVVLVVQATDAVARASDLALAERKAAEAALEAEKAVLRNLIDHLPFAVFIKDRESRFVAANRELARILGASRPEQLAGKTDFDFFQEVEARGYRDVERRVMETGEPELNRVTEETMPWGLRVLLESKYPLRDARGNITGVIAVIADVTEARRAEEALAEATTALQEREALHRILFDSAADPLFFHTDKGILLDVNEVACTRLGYRREELVGKHLSIIDTPAYGVQIEARMADLLRRGSALFESEHRTRDGRAIPVEVHARVVDYHGSRVVFSVSRDITERKNAERALRAQEEQVRQGQKMEAVGRLAGGVAHDFNNILTVITGYSDLLLETLGESHPARAEVREIHSAAQRASSLTRQLLAFSRRQILHPEPFDANDMLRSMHSLLRRLIGEDVELVLNLGDLPGAALADRNQIEQVILNLAVNARDSMPDGGRLLLETRVAEIPGGAKGPAPDLVPGSYVAVAVTDTGSGIPAEQIHLIFEPFFTTKEKGKGTGLGLPTAYGIVRQSGGTITVYSEPGSGSTFRVYLPLTRSLPTSSEGSPVPALPEGTETVLIVEDEEAVRAFAERVFRAHGYTVLSAPDGAEALDLARTHTGSIDLLISDVVMPGMNGRELADRLTALRPGLRVLHVSGYTEDAILRRGVIQPGTRFLAKPYSAGAILARSRELLDGR